MFNSILDLEYISESPDQQQQQQQQQFTWQNDVSKEAAPQVNVRAEYRLEEALVHPIMVSSNQFRLKKDLRSPG